MKKSKIVFAVFGILALVVTVASAVFAVLLNNAMPIEVAGQTTNSFELYARFCRGVFNSLIGTEGHVFPQSLLLILSFFGGVALVLIGLVWIIIAICKKKFLGILYGFLVIPAAFVVSFGLFIPIENGLQEIYGNGFVYNFLTNINGQLCFYLAIAAAALILVAFVTFIVYAALNKKVSKKANKVVEQPKEVAPVADEKPVEQLIVEEKAPVVEEKPAEEPEVEDKVEEKPAVKPVEKKVEPKPAVKPAEKKPAEKKVEPKPAAKPAEKKPAEKKAEPKPAAKPVVKKEQSKAESGEKKEVYKAYHVSQHADGGWQVKGAGSEKALKRFKTQAEAIKYAKEVSESQGTTYLVHSMKGKIRKA